MTCSKCGLKPATGMYCIRCGNGLMVAEIEAATAAPVTLTYKELTAQLDSAKSAAVAATESKYEAINASNMESAASAYLHLSKEHSALQVQYAAATAQVTELQAELAKIQAAFKVASAPVSAPVVTPVAPAEPVTPPAA